MARLINADEVIKRLEVWNTDDPMDQALYRFALSRILEAPTVDAVPVRHGRWKPMDLTWGRSIYYCTSCGESVEVPTEMGKPIYRFCPNCGAKMDEVEEDE